MSLPIIKNTTGYVNPSASILDTGWTISGVYAIHVPCNAGKIISQSNLMLVTGRVYNITYTVDNYVSGSVYVSLGTANGTARTANGKYSELITCTGSAQMSFYSDGALRISLLSFYDIITGPTLGATVSFNEGENKWGSEYSYQPEQMVKFIDDFFAMKNGQLYLQNDNDIRNNFFGVQYSSKVTFYVNISPQSVKNFYGLVQQSTSAWGSPNDGDIYILPHKGKPSGQKSRLKAGNYRSLQGDFFADFLRDLSDPRFTTTLDALFKGGALQGHIMEITLQNDDTTGVRLVHVDISTAPQNLTR